MRGPAPFLGAVTGLTHQSCSRIPHLRVHILSRQSRSKSCKTTPFPSNLQQRYRSTVIRLDANKSDISESVGSISSNDVDQSPRTWTAQEVERSSAEDTEAPRRTASTAQSTLSSIVARLQRAYAGGAEAEQIDEESATIPKLVQEGHPERVLFGLLDPSIGHSFIRDADDETFARAFCLLNPRYLIEPFRDLSRFVKPALYSSVRTIEERSQSFTTALNTVVSQRQKSGHALTLDIYRHLLDCARVMGDGPMAIQLIDVMMLADGVEPDLQCYNHYMEAVCWSNAYSRDEKFRLRVLPKSLAIRGSKNPPRDLRGHSVATRGQTPERREHTLRLRTLRKFRQIVERGLKGDEATFTSLMTAMAREGQLEDAKSVLKSVWNIDVDLLGQYDEEEIESPTFYEEDSPLRPTGRLLFTVAHIFGSNNHVGLAFSLVDYISRNYNLEIPYAVWLQLCEWTMVLSLQRGGQGRKQGQQVGQVSPTVFPSLWQAMTDEPHKIHPDVPLLILHARMRRERLDLNLVVDQLRAAKSIIKQERAHLLLLTEQMLSMIQEEIWKAGEWDDLLSPTFLDLRRKLLLASITMKRDTHLLIFELRRFLTRISWNRTGFSREWEVRRLPLLVEEFADFIPNVVRNTLRTGTIELETADTRKEMLTTGTLDFTKEFSWNDTQRGAWGPQSRTVANVTEALDTDDQEKLKRNLLQVQPVLERRELWCFSCERAGHSYSHCPDRPVATPVRRAGATHSSERTESFVVDTELDNRAGYEEAM